VIVASLLAAALGATAPADTLTADYTVGGVHVIQRRTDANDVVAVDLYLLGGAQQLTADNEGIEALALKAAQYGTSAYPGQAWRRAMARTGSVVVVGPESDWTLVGFRGVVEQFDSTWAVFADLLVHPALDSSSVAVARQHMTLAARARDISPDGALSVLADNVAFAGHPYGLEPEGTETSLAKLSPAIVQRYAREQYVTSRMLLVVVGNVSRAAIEAAVVKTLGVLPAGGYTWHPPAPVAPRPAPSITLVQRSVSTNYLLGYFQGPPVTSHDYLAFEVATELLGARLSNAIRQQRSLSYAAHSPFLGRAVAAGGIYVSTPLPMEVLPIVRATLDSMRTMEISSQALTYFTRQFVTGYLASNSSNAAQAGSLAEAQIYQGDYHKARDEQKALRSLSPMAVQFAARTYMRNTQFVFLGDTSLVRGIRVNGM
jgi:zinc protease